MHYAVRVAMGLRSWQRLELTEFKPMRKQSSSQGNHRPSRHSGATREQSFSKAIRAEVPVGLYLYAVVVARGLRLGF